MIPLQKQQALIGWLSKLGVPFCVLSRIRHLLFRVPKRGPDLNFDNYPIVGALSSVSVVSQRWMHSLRSGAMPGIGCKARAWGVGTPDLGVSEN